MPSDLKSAVAHAARWVTAIALAAIIGACSWLAIIEEGHGGHILGTTWTSHDFPEGLGNALGATENLSRMGLWGTLGIAVVMVILFAVLEPWLPGREWRKGFSFAPILFLLWGLVFCPLVDAKQVLTESGEFVYLPSGLFASNSSSGTIASAIVASIVSALAMARILQLVRTPEWWKPNKVDRTMIVDPQTEALLELPEERPDKSNERTG